MYDDALSCQCAATINSSLALTGEYDNPTPPDANDPGLDNQPGYRSQSGKATSPMLITIVVVLLALFGLWYFFGK